MNQRNSQNRRSLRKVSHDYRQPGTYFVTINAFNKRKLFGNLNECEVNLNKFGQVLDTRWKVMPSFHLYMKLDEYVIMPNHFHALFHIKQNIERYPNGGVPSIIRDFKSFTTRKINELRGTPGGRVWQRSYWDRIIYNAKSLCEVREYIKTNPGAAYHRFSR